MDKRMVSQRPIHTWTDGVPVEASAMQQLENVAQLPIVHEHGIAVMPDVHLGYGATVGSVIPTRGAIIPAAVGVDIGCGVIAQRLTLLAEALPDNLVALRLAIEAAVPHGGPGKVGSWTEPHRGGVPADVGAAMQPYADGLRRILDAHPKIARQGKSEVQVQHAVAQYGTLGTGNHFIEICVDEADGVWIMLHSGSRGIGNRIGTYFIERAKEYAAERGFDLPDRDLAWLDDDTDLLDDYLRAMRWAQAFALANRAIMLGRVQAALRNWWGMPVFPAESAVQCHHNYAGVETHFGEDIYVTRKGAIDASEGKLGIIPANMGRASKIVLGKGHPDALRSASHGAGRVMSRGQARRTIALETFQDQMQGIEAPVDTERIDESPSAYKDIDAVMAAQRDLVEEVHTLRQIVVVKG